MSLDVHLLRNKLVSYDKGKTFSSEKDEVHWSNITHNLVKEEDNPLTAKEIIPILEKGLNDLKARPDHFKKFDAPNGWGLYEHFVPFVKDYLEARKKYPDAEIY